LISLPRDEVLEGIRHYIYIEHELSVKNIIVKTIIILFTWTPFRPRDMVLICLSYMLM